jgi:hypothetical protein
MPRARARSRHARRGYNCEMTHEAHKARHEMLHRCLDELLADYLRHHAMDRVFIANIRMWDLIQWSHDQTKNPTVDPDGVEAVATCLPLS